MKTIIAGTRTFTGYSLLCQAVKDSGIDITTVVSGGASGVDSLGERWAKENDIPLLVFHADWKIHGKKAGIIRNIEMALSADSLIALWDGKSRGTRHMIDEARRRGLRVYIVSTEG